MVCAGITFASDRITIVYNAADGTRGASWSDPYLLVDIYDTAIANGWDVEKSEDNYTIRELLTVTGTATYFFINNENVQFINNTGAASYIYFYANVRIYRSKLKGEATPVARRLLLGLVPNIGLTCEFQDVVCDTWYQIYNFNQVIFRNVQFYAVANSYLSNLGVLVDIDNYISKHSTYGFILQENPASATRIKAENCTYGNMAGYGSYKIYNYEARNNTTDVRIYINGSNRLCEYVDSYLDIDKIAFLGAGFAGNNRSGQVLLYSTFRLISNINNVDYVLRDNYGDIVSSGSFVSEYEEEVIFWSFEGSSDAVGAVTSELKDAYEPFNLTITKAGYQDFVVSGIEIRKETGTNVVTGDQIIISGVLREPEYVEVPVPSEASGSMVILNSEESGNDFVVISNGVALYI